MSSNRQTFESRKTNRQLMYKSYSITESTSRSYTTLMRFQCAFLYIFAYITLLLFSHVNLPITSGLMLLL